MLVKNGPRIIARILKPRNIQTCSAAATFLLGNWVLLFGAPLYAQDLLLKEYIYLDGRLLAVERQVQTQAAQQPASDSGKEMKSAQYIYPAINELTPPGIICKPGIPGIPVVQGTCAFQSPVFAPFPRSDKGQSRLGDSENFNLQYGAYRRHWKTSEIVGHENGGSYDGL